MHLKSLYLKNFRTFGERRFHFESSVNLFWGMNAQGKTTILEAIYLLMTGRSFRTSHLTDMTQYGSHSFLVEAAFEKHGITQTLRYVLEGKERRIFYNHSPCTSAVHLWGIIPGVVITPDDDALVKGGPAERRSFLDHQLAQSDPLYVHHLTRYHRALKQRNQLLRQKLQNTLDAWENEMAVSGAYLTWKRDRTIRALSDRGETLFKELSGTDALLSMDYTRHGCESREAIRIRLLDKFRQHKPKELQLGFTLSGPHKDDFLIRMDQQEVRVFASEGQKRMTVAALKLAAWHQIQESTDQLPLLLVDDLNNGLDASRRLNLINYMQRLGQVFLTSNFALELPASQMRKITAS